MKENNTITGIKNSTIWARKIARLRKELHFTQKEFANTLGVSKSYLAKIETDKALDNLGMYMLDRIMEKLQVEPVNFFSCTTLDLFNAALFVDHLENKKDKHRPIPCYTQMPDQMMVCEHNTTRYGRTHHISYRRRRSLPKDL